MLESEDRVVKKKQSSDYMILSYRLGLSYSWYRKGLQI